MATYIVASIIAVIFIMIVVGEIKKRKDGHGGCSCGCSGCSIAGECHKTEQ